LLRRSRVRACTGLGVSEKVQDGLIQTIPRVFRAALIAWLLCIAPVVVYAADSAQKPGHAAIASAHRLATEAGVEVLAQGGNAFDAAIAVAAALSVVEPQSSGIGGGGVFLLHVVGDRKPASIKDVMVDARETAPASTDAKDYLDAKGDLDRDKS